jgi:hypothetical protein
MDTGVINLSEECFNMLVLLLAHDTGHDFFQKSVVFKEAIAQAEKDQKFNDLLSKSKSSESQTRPKIATQTKKALGETLSEKDNAVLTARIGGGENFKAAIQKVLDETKKNTLILKLQDALVPSPEATSTAATPVASPVSERFTSLEDEDMKLSLIEDPNKSTKVLDEVLKYVEEDISRNVGMEIEGGALGDETSRYVSIGNRPTKRARSVMNKPLHLPSQKRKLPESSFKSSLKSSLGRRGTMVIPRDIEGGPSLRRTSAVLKGPLLSESEIKIEPTPEIFKKLNDPSQDIETLISNYVDDQLYRILNKETGLDYYVGKVAYLEERNMNFEKFVSDQILEVDQNLPVETLDEVSMEEEDDEEEVDQKRIKVDETLKLKSIIDNLDIYIDGLISEIKSDFIFDFDQPGKMDEQTSTDVSGSSMSEGEITDFSGSSSSSEEDNTQVGNTQQFVDSEDYKELGGGAPRRSSRAQKAAEKKMKELNSKYRDERKIMAKRIVAWNQFVKNLQTLKSEWYDTNEFLKELGIDKEHVLFTFSEYTGHMTDMDEGNIESVFKYLEGKNLRDNSSQYKRFMKYATQHWPPEYKNVFTVDLDIVVKSKWGKDKWLETNLSAYYSDKVFVRTTIDEINLLMSDNGSVVLSKEERDLIATFGFNFMNYYKDTLFGGNLGAVSLPGWMRDFCVSKWGTKQQNDKQLEKAFTNRKPGNEVPANIKVVKGKHPRDDPSQSEECQPIKPTPDNTLNNASDLKKYVGWVNDELKYKCRASSVSDPQSICPRIDYKPSSYSGFQLTINGGEDNKIVARLSGSHPSLNGWVMDFQITKSGEVLSKKHTYRQSVQPKTSSKSIGNKTNTLRMVIETIKGLPDMSGDAKTLDLLRAINPLMVTGPETYCKPIVEDFLWKTSGDFFQESEAILNIKKGRQTAFLSNDWPSAIRFMSILECVEELSDYWGGYTGQKKAYVYKKSRSSGGGIVPLKLSDKEKTRKKNTRRKNTIRKNTRRKNTRRKNTRRKNTRRKNTRRKNTRRKNTRRKN